MAISGLLVAVAAPAGAAPFIPRACGITSIQPQAKAQAVGAHGVGATKSGAMALNQVLALAFTPPTGEVNVAYTAQPTATGGLPPYDWDLATGTLPAGLSLNLATGRISGTPTTAGSTNVSIEVTDENLDSVTLARTITIVAGPLLSGFLLSGEVTAPYSSGFASSGGIGPFVWTMASGALPAGLTLNSSTGSITGTPTVVVGCSSFTVRVTDANTRVGTRSGSIVVLAGPTATFTPGSGEVGAAYTAQPSASGGTTPYTWAVSAGTLPNGLSINTSSGAIGGTPTTAGTTGFTVQATDAKGGRATKAVSIAIIAAPTLTFAAPPAGEVSVPYGDQLTFAGGVSPYAWSVSAGSLPTGLTLDAGTGLMGGTPTAPGTFPFSVQIVDANGFSDSKAATVVIAKTTTSVSLSSSASVRFGTSITLTASVTPDAAGGTVTFTDVPTTGPQSGTRVTLGTGTLSGGSASVDVTLPAFGVNTITASYGGDGTYAAADSSTTPVEVSAYAGELIVTEFRSSGPSGAADSYAELLNTGAPVPLAGVVVKTSSGSTSSLPADAGLLGTRRSYLLTGADFSLGAIATSDFATTLGTGGIEVVAPDTANTQTDAVGPASGFHLGTGLPAMTGTPSAEYAWVRTELAGAAVDTRNNASDFVVVSRNGDQVGGVQSVLGSASPTGTADPYQDNAGMQSTLLNTTVAVGAPPNRVVVAGNPGQLTVRRRITNTSGVTITSARVRVTALSEVNGPPEPGVPSQPARVAQLRAINPVAPGFSLRPLIGWTNLSLDFPATTGVGGLNSTWTLPLPGGSLAPGASVRVAFTFAIDTHGTFWFGYDVDATAGSTGNARPGHRSAHVSPRPSRNVRPGDSGRIG